MYVQPPPPPLVGNQRFKDIALMFGTGLLPIWFSSARACFSLTITTVDSKYRYYALAETIFINMYVIAFACIYIRV